MEQEELRGIIIHVRDVSVSWGSALDTPSVGLTLRLGTQEEHFVLSPRSARELGKELTAAADAAGEARLPR